ncbi:MAG: PTS glucose/sucrose transporter subunit IIB, partial [Clostridiaceae bacterium]|nr:PTS glucose/sucrose transporter subunit IIB [Clostridiaceae bacterium]
MDYRESAKQVFELIGGKANLISAAHCATRLRLVVADESVCDKGAIENVDGVKGVFSASGQLQIIFGTGTVNKVYDLSLIPISEPTRQAERAFAVFCLKKKRGGGGGG